jgi:hypothetical protein
VALQGQGDRKGLCDTDKAAVTSNFKRVVSSFHAPEYQRRTSGTRRQLQHIPDYGNLLGYRFVYPISKQVVAIRADNLSGCLSPPKAFKRMCSGLVSASSSAGQKMHRGTLAPLFPE